MDRFKQFAYLTSVNGLAIKQVETWISSRGLAVKLVETWIASGSSDLGFCCETGGIMAWFYLLISSGLAVNLVGWVLVFWV